MLSFAARIQRLRTPPIAAQPLTDAKQLLQHDGDGDAERRAAVQQREGDLSTAPDTGAAREPFSTGGNMRSCKLSSIAVLWFWG